MSNISIVTQIPDHAVERFLSRVNKDSSLVYEFDIGEQSVPTNLYAGSKVNLIAEGIGVYTSLLSHWQYTEDALNNNKKLLLSLQFVRIKSGATASQVYENISNDTTTQMRSTDILKVATITGSEQKKAKIMYSHCIRCNRPLKKRESQLDGFGPSCKALYAKEVNDRIGINQQLALQI